MRNGPETSPPAHPPRRHRRRTCGSGRFASLAQEVGEKHAAHALAAQYLAADQKAHQTVVVAAATSATAFDAFLFVTNVLLLTAAPFAQEMGKEHAADATASEDLAADQQAQDAAILAATLLEFLVLTGILVLFL